MLVQAIAVVAGLVQPVADTPSVTVVPPDPQVTQQAVSFMDDYFQHLSGPDVLAQFRRDYAGYVAYFGKIVKKSVVLREKDAFVRRWPQRRYRPRQDSIHTACGRVEGELVCSVVGLVDYQCQNPDRHAAATGVARFSANVWFSRNGPEIIGETSAVVG